MEYYLAYGSNLNIGQMTFRCPGAKIKGTAWINDYELLFKGSKTGAYLTIEKKKGSQVPVAVWEVTEQHIRVLDRYEGYPMFYYKKSIPIDYKGFGRCKDRSVNAFVYIMHEERSIATPTQYYIDACGEGYDYFGFDRAYLGEALEKSYEAEEKRMEALYGKEWWRKKAN